MKDKSSSSSWLGRLLLAGACMLAPTTGLLAEPSANDFIGGQIVSIDAEGGRIALQHNGIAHLRLPAGTTTFRYVEARWIIGRRAGDRVRFRADRIDLTLRMTALVYLPG